MGSEVWGGEKKKRKEKGGKGTATRRLSLVLETNRNCRSVQLPF